MNDVEVMAGQGTIGLDILDDMWDVDTVIVPIGVQADNVHGMKASFEAGRIVSHYAAPTIADGCAVKIPGDLTFEIVKELVNDIVTISEDELEVVMKDLLQRGKAVVEGAGALATAALLSGKVEQYTIGKKVVAVISGGNVDLKRISSVCEHFFVANEVK